jgi:CubicO group peptidase (beta-lactamase class C family)
MVVHPLDILLLQAASDSPHSAVAAAVTQNGKRVFSCERGAEPETLFDIASLTKIVCTSAALYQLVSDHQLSFDDPVSRFLPDFAQHGKEHVTVRALMGHRSGLPAWDPLFVPVMVSPQTSELFSAQHRSFRPSADLIAASRAMIVRQVMASPLVHPSGKRVYSDYGFLALGMMIEAIVGQSLHDLTQEVIFPALGLECTTFRPIADMSIDESIPPTGLSRPRTPAAGQDGLYPLPEQPERAFPGWVDDDNAFAMGGVAGHAGVFSTASEVAEFGQRLLEERAGAGRLGKAEVLAEMLAPDEAGGEPLRGLGFDHPSGRCSSTGQLMSRGEPSTFGHLGFTGCSLWVDPIRDLSVCLLSNAVFPHRKNLGRLRTFRPLFHDILIETLEADL